MEKRKNEILSKLMTIQNDDNTKSVYKSWISQIINYIKGVE